MSARILAVPGTNTIYATQQMSIPKWDDETTVLCDIRFAALFRGPKTRPSGWSHDIGTPGTWPQPRRFGFYNDPAAPTSLITGYDESSMFTGSFEPWSRIACGTKYRKFIMGRCKYANNAGVSGATVSAYLTSDNTLVGVTTSDSNGYYELGTPHSGINHYVVARADSGFGGVTVNTLQPTNRDGS